MVNVKSHSRKSKTGKTVRVSSHYRKNPTSTGLKYPKKSTLKIAFNTDLKDDDIEAVRESIEDSLGVEILSIDEDVSAKPKDPKPKKVVKASNKQDGSMYPESISGTSTIFTTLSAVMDKFDMEIVDSGGSFDDDYKKAQKIAKKNGGVVYTMVDTGGGVNDVSLEKGFHWVNRIGIYVLKRRKGT